MSKRTTYELKKEILNVLKEGELTYTRLQTKLSTNYDSVKNNCEEMQDLGLVKIKKFEKHRENGKPYYDVILTERGRDFLNRTDKDKSKEKKSS